MANNGFKAGKANPADPNGFIDSMAEEIEKAFLLEWRTVKGWPLENFDEVGRVERHILFVAIARGVLKHLQEHAAEGFNISELTVKQKPGNNIVIDGNTDNYPTSGSYQHKHDISDVPQKPFEEVNENRVISEYSQGFQINIEDIP